MEEGSAGVQQQVSRTIQTLARYKHVPMKDLYPVVGNKGSFHERISGKTSWRVNELEGIAEILKVDVGDLFKPLTNGGEPIIIRSRSSRSAHHLSHAA